MAETAKPAGKKTSKGGSKGGTRFPRLDIAEALAYSKKLVSKTHNGPQPEQTILVGVFNNKGPEGGVRASALKQYGLLEGDAKGYTASALARNIEAAVPDERPALVRKAFVTPKVFKQVYDMLQSETATRARVRQAVITGEVHPDSADACVEYFINGAIYARLGSTTGDSIVLVSAASAPETAPDDRSEDPHETESEKAKAAAEAKAAADATTGNTGTPPSGNKPGLAVSLNVDSSSDPDKLEKQLKLLREYGVI